MKRRAQLEVETLAAESQADQAYRLMRMMLSDQQGMQSIFEMYENSDVFRERLEELEAWDMIKKMCKADFR